MKRKFGWLAVVLVTLGAALLTGAVAVDFDLKVVDKASGGTGLTWFALGYCLATLVCSVSVKVTRQDEAATRADAVKVERVPLHLDGTLDDERKLALRLWEINPSLKEFDLARLLNYLGSLSCKDQVQPADTLCRSQETAP